MDTMSRIRVVFVLAFALVTTALGQAPENDKVTAAADRALERAAKLSPAAAPGCAVGVSLNGKSVYEKAFGMAELEHSIPLTAESILESGSVAKQFTAASIVMLSLEGKLGLDDPVRKYIPELPDYGSPLTVRHLLNHTSGIRDWGSVMALTGYGRGDRLISQDLAMDVITHQKGLDFKPGAEYSYSNSGYTLLTTIVERVSKQSLSAFTEERIFKPLGMTHTSWRTDYQKLVPGRAQAYEGPLQGPFRLDMPFMNVYGNGGMLTTVGDWLKWNAALDAKTFGAPLVSAMETTGVLNDGRKITYALGLDVTTVNGQLQVSHSGSTAGYATYLSRYPDLKLSIAVMCNGASRAPGTIERDIFNEIAGPFPVAAQPAAVEVKAEELQKYVGLWRDEKTHFPIRTSVNNSTLRLGNGVMRPVGDGTFRVGQQKLTFQLGSDGKPTGLQLDNAGAISRLIPETEWSPSAEELKSVAGTWHSDEADATFSILVEGGQAFFIQRPSTRIPLRPVYKDHFTAGGGQVMWLTRNGKDVAVHVGASRMRDVTFDRVR
jgi:CubicO group peptidase (beta-lactamase class C family)